MSVFPIDVTVDRLVEFHGLADVLCQQELGRLPSHTTDDSVAEIILLMALNGETGDTIQQWLHDQPEAIAHRAVPPLAPVLPFKGAFCIPNALPGIPYGDGKRIWTPAFGCYAGTDWQDRILDEAVRRGHTWFEYQVSGFPYRQDYPELALEPQRTVDDLTKIHRRGLRTLIAFRDDRGADLSYLQPVADVTQDLVDGIFGIYEVNGVLKDPTKVLSVLKQSRALWPMAILGAHFTDLVQSESYGLVDFTAAVEQAGLNVLFFQASGWLQSVDQVAARVADYTRRLGGPKFHNYPTLSHGVVLAELTTSRTYRDWTEAQGVTYADAVRARPMAPDGGVWSVPVTGYLDGGTP